MGAPSPPPRVRFNSGSVPRLLVGARLGFSPHSVFRTFIGVDGEFGPAGARELRLTTSSLHSRYQAIPSASPWDDGGHAMMARVPRPVPVTLRRRLMQS